MHTVSLTIFLLPFTPYTQPKCLIKCKRVTCLRYFTELSPTYTEEIYDLGDVPRRELSSKTHIRIRLSPLRRHSEHTKNIYGQLVSLSRF